MNKARQRTFESPIEAHRERRLVKDIRARIVKVLDRNAQEQRIIMSGGSHHGKNFEGMGCYIEPFMPLVKLGAP